MKKRATLPPKTYGRVRPAPKKRGTDFDDIFNNSCGSPFGTSDSSAGCSLNRGDCRRSDNVSDGDNRVAENLSTLSLEDKNIFIPDKMTKKSTAKQTKGKNVNKEKKKTGAKKCTNKKEVKENIVENYDDIADDSFVIEIESKQCNKAPKNSSTPLLNITNTTQNLPQDWNELTPIIQKVSQTPNISTSAPFSTQKDVCISNVSTRKSTRQQKRLSWSRKVVIDKYHKDVSLNLSDVNNSSFLDTTAEKSANYEAESIYVISDVSDLSTNLSCAELMRSIDANSSHLAAINRSIQRKEFKEASPPNLHNSHNEHSLPFNASQDLFASSGYLPEEENDDEVGLSFIPEVDSYFEYSSSHSSSDVSSQSHSNIAAENISNNISHFHRLSSHSICMEVSLSAKDDLLQICGQTNYIPFSTCIPTRMMSKCVKIGEGVYGEVFRSFSGNQSVAIKIIPMDGDFEVNDCPQKTFAEILPEAVIAKELSDLAHGNSNLNFCQVNKISCVQGSFPVELLKLWDDYAKRKVSENDRPDCFPEEQLFAVFEFVDGGTALENFEMANYRQTLSVLRQVVFSLAVAESRLEFEHRDLHIGNVLVRKSPEALVRFSLNGEDYEFESEGVFATIIDFTISRLKKDGLAVFCDIASDDGLFEGEGDFQFDVYRDMRKTNGNVWSEFYPYTNVLWIEYLCKKLLDVIKVKDTGREHRHSLQHLRQIKAKIRKYDSCVHLALDHDLWNY